jgi:tetratricopeptide (TPR) repeat protein
MLGGRHEVETILMRSLPRLLLVGFAGIALASPVMGQKADDEILPKSLQLQREARALMAAGKLDQAEDMLETALAVDPRNRGAFVDIARVAEKQHLYGKAIRMTNKALLLEPNDPDAIAVQGEAMVEMGALARAQANLQKLQAICARSGCPQVAQLSAAISRGPTVASAKTPDVPKNN